MKKILYENLDPKRYTVPLKAPYILPFLFESFNEERRFFIHISLWDLHYYDSRWMNCEHLGENCLIPDNDLTIAIYEFNSEIEALKYIQDWWKQQQL